MGYSNIGKSPLDGVANFFAGVGDTKKKAKAKKDQIKAAPAKAKAAVKNKAKQQVAKVVNCQTVGHAAKRGQVCSRCGSKML